MLKAEIEKTLSEQVVAETYSAYLYLAMSAHCHAINLEGAANWFRIQVQEELLHASKLFDYIVERGGKPVLGAIDQPPLEWDSPLAAFEAALAHEGLVTDLINKLVDLAIKESDHATNSMLQWFVDEQVEEEAGANAIVQKLRLVQGNGGGLFMVDKELAARVFTPPAATA
jgi:ferritin